MAPVYKSEDNLWVAGSPFTMLVLGMELQWSNSAAEAFYPLTPLEGHDLFCFEMGSHVVLSDLELTL